jgi:hypothetical protein
MQASQDKNNTRDNNAMNEKYKTLDASNLLVETPFLGNCVCDDNTCLQVV